MYKATCKVLVLGALLAAAAPAMADGAAPVRQVAVKVGDLNLQSVAGREELQRRLTRAARGICPDTYSRSVQTKAAGRACVNQAVDRALGDLGQRQLAGAPALRPDRS